MRIQTTGRYDWRLDLYDNVDELLNENTRSGAIDASCEFTQQMLRNLACAIEHPDMTKELAERLDHCVRCRSRRVTRGPSSV